MREKDAQRVVDTFTGPWEKRVLPKMAASLPNWVTPDHLTLLGHLATLIIAAAYLLVWISRWWLFAASFGFILHWYADSLDGTLARVRHTERERYGYFVDHISDAWMVVVICVALGMSPLMQVEIAMMLAICYLLLNVYVHISAYTHGEFRISFMKFGPTEVRIFFLVFNTMLFFGEGRMFKFQGEWLTVMDLGGLFFCIVFLGIFIVIALKTAFFLDKLDRGKKNPE